MCWSFPSTMKVDVYSGQRGKYDWENPRGFYSLASLQSESFGVSMCFLERARGAMRAKMFCLSMCFLVRACGALRARMLSLISLKPHFGRFDILLVLFSSS